MKFVRTKIFFHPRGTVVGRKETSMHGMWTNYNTEGPSIENHENYIIWYQNCRANGEGTNVLTLLL